MDNNEAAHAAIHDATAFASHNYDRTVAQMKDGVAAATAGLAQTQAQLKTQMDAMTKTAEQVFAFGQGNVEAMMKSAQILMTGLQDLGRHMATNAQTAIDETVTTYRAATGVKSVKEAIELQTTHARASITRSVAEAGKIADASVKLVEQATAPLSARATLAAELVQHRA